MPFLGNLKFLLVVIQFINYTICENSTEGSTQDPNCEKHTDSKIRSSGTGTVLFTPSDLDKQCWSEDELALLTARMILEDALPDPRSLSAECNEDVEELIEYFKSMIESVRSCTKGRKRHIMLLALTDLLGGYLHNAVLPIVKRGYYTGIIDYAEIEKIIQFYEEIKWFLRTNGQGWTKPLIFKKTVHASPINFKREIKDKHIPNSTESCCQKLLYYEHEPLKSKKRSVSERGIYFPLPFFDAKHKPTAIVVPFKKFSLRNIESKRSAYLVMKYYLTAHRCLEEKNAKREMVEKFQNNLYAWIVKEAVPKLKDDKFYSAFGGILRVEATLKALGAKEGDLPCGSEEGEEEIGAVPAIGTSLKKTKVVLTAILLVIMFWFVVGSCFICYRMKSGSKPKDDNNKSKYIDSSGTYASFRTFFSKSKTSSKMSFQESTCRCCESTITDTSEKTQYSKSAENDQSQQFSISAEYDQTQKSKKKSKTRLFKKSIKSSPCLCPAKDAPAVIDASQTMKVLPSIAEMSENSTAKHNHQSSKRILFSNSTDVSSSDFDNRPCAPLDKQNKDTRICPFYSEKSTSVSSSKTGPIYKDHGQDTDLDVTKDFNHQLPSSTMRHDKDSHSDNTKKRINNNQPKDSYLGNTTKRINHSQPNDSYSNDLTKRITSLEMLHKTHDDTYKSSDSSRNSSHEGKANNDGNRQNHGVKLVSGNYPDQTGQKSNASDDNDILDYHMSAACHTSMSGSYNLTGNKPNIFGYDFQTSTSSDLSDEDADDKTNSSSKY